MKILSVKKSVEFQKISKKGQKFHSKTLLLLSFPSSQIYFKNIAENKKADDFCRVGYTVAKTVSKSAVIRNLAKRRLREAFQILAPNYAKLHQDYVVIARREIINSDFAKISADLKFCLKRIHQPTNPKNQTKPKQ
ncbi:MAG: ribonuclease P protein component [Proteobacteria bacterium]|nr:ribonuclease P protein component [Pseudomonadota bacterium]